MFPRVAFEYGQRSCALATSASASAGPRRRTPPAAHRARGRPRCANVEWACRRAVRERRRRRAGGTPARSTAPVQELLGVRSSQAAASRGSRSRSGRSTAPRGARTACGRPAPALLALREDLAHADLVGGADEVRPHLRVRALLARDREVLVGDEVEQDELADLLGVLGRVGLGAAQAGAVEVAVVGGLLAVEGDEADRRRVLGALGLLPARARSRASPRSRPRRRWRRRSPGCPWCRSGRRARSACPCP